MLDLRKIHLVFHVPEGLEFIAVKDIQTSLHDDTIIQQPKFYFDAKSGKVHMFCKVESIDKAKHYLQTVPLLSIYSMTLIASASVIPTHLFTDNKETTEHGVCNLIVEQTKKTSWDLILQDKRRRDKEDEATISFRATFKKEQVKHPSLPSSQEIAGYIGFAFHELFKDWKVKMTDYTYEIFSFWFQTPNNDLRKECCCFDDDNDESIILLLGVTIPIQEDQRQRNRVFVGRTSLNPCIAYCLALCSDPKPGQVILDMCCGTGTIPIEGASKFKNVFWLGSEVKVKTLEERALGNVNHCNLKNIDLMLGDGRKFCFRDHSIDTIVSDWPWGLRENSFNQIQGLYPKFMKQMWRVLRLEGKAYIVTQGRKLMNRVLAYDWCQKLWDVNEIIPIGIGGYDVYLYILSRKQ
ncbi:putative RNA methylase family UPF0020-domain-containing protein [Cokeromyces recurvatus]|uniref:putative RNA methylase family UPF0020-domain-containing protein n=1 Tax=Cokeromyces recurvatus TaxID=90255 RepID=UPI002220B79C|nr:putative RNA methylase family UPF0020-domain-containing protein [Cokeromyces recurvatus]KAI7905830.1 putative RNA methylase family UPF0020-domain-containing protein [Cokeromyces recurvatus]